MSTFFYVEVRVRTVETDQYGITDIRELYAKLRRFDSKAEALAAHAMAATALKEA
jgi:hypothetical protein